MGLSSGARLSHRGCVCEGVCFSSQAESRALFTSKAGESFEPFQSKASSGPGSVSQLQDRVEGQPLHVVTRSHTSCRVGVRGSCHFLQRSTALEKGVQPPAKSLPRDLHPPTLSHLLDTWPMSQDGPRQQVARDQPPNRARHRATMLFQKLLCPRPVSHFCSVPGVVAVW